MTLRGELHNRGSAGRCEACGEVFPCPTGLAIYEAVKRELEHPTPSPAAPPVTPVITPAIVQPPRVRWEDLPDHDYRCPRCLHWWVSHGAEPDTDGCMVLLSSMAERTAMAEEDWQLQREGVPPEVLGRGHTTISDIAGALSAPRRAPNGRRAWHAKLIGCAPMKRR